MVATSMVKRPWCPEWDEPETSVPCGRALLVLGVLLVVLVLAIAPPAIAALSIAGSGPLDRIYQSGSAVAGLLLPWMQLPAQIVLVLAASLLPAAGADR
jgi:hypothetical protein